ncbi:MAG: tRNA pseudouridine(54/55) synthase Pus10 [Candidatus Hecatellaceae archaeon]
MAEARLSPLEMARKLLSAHRLCDSCLGRQFASLGYGLTNRERGRALKLALLLEACLKLEAGDSESLETLKMLAINGGVEEARQTLEKHGVKVEGAWEGCELCGDKLSSVEDLARMAVELMGDYEFSSFLVGAQIPAEVLEAEDGLRGRYGIPWGESIKGEFTREVGKIISRLTGKPVNFKAPELLVTISPYSDGRKVSVKASPIFIEGRYRKLVAGIPQSRWLCSRCRGEGCPECNWTGRRYQESVEEIIEGPLLEQAEGEGASFHAGGREDIDARVLGSGRPFVVEIKNPKRRSLNLEEAEAKINSSGKVEVEGLRMAGREAVARVKAAEAHRKTYHIVVEAEEDLSDAELERLERELTGKTISQWTPRRVLHRRADKERLKKVYRLEVQRLSERAFEALVECQGGLYVKELVDGDEGRTKPSMAEILGKKLKCTALTVLNVEAEGGKADG